MTPEAGWLAAIEAARPIAALRGVDLGLPGGRDRAHSGDRRRDRRDGDPRPAPARSWPIDSRGSSREAPSAGGDRGPVAARTFRPPALRDRRPRLLGERHLPSQASADHGRSRQRRAFPPDRRTIRGPVARRPDASRGEASGRVLTRRLDERRRLRAVDRILVTTPGDGFFDELRQFSSVLLTA